MFDTQRSPRRGFLALGAALLLAAATSAPSTAQVPGAVYTATNDAQANAVVAFRRDTDGRLMTVDTYSTGGLGTGSGLGSQGALTLDHSGQHLFAVNPGSDTVSVFSVGPRGLELLDVEDSGGTKPISVTVRNNLVYVLNAGGAGNVSGLRLRNDGSLVPLPDSTRALSGSGTGPAQVAFTPRGDFLVVTEKGTNSILTYPVRKSGLIGDAIVNPSEGATPFGFSFGLHATLLVSEAAGGAAGQSSVSSYAVLADGTLDPISSALPTTQSAACWLVTGEGGRYAYVTNTGSASVTGLKVRRDGSVELLDADGVTAPSGNGPIDAAVTRDGRFVYVLNGGDGSLGIYAVGAEGSLSLLNTMTGLPASTVGLAVL